MRKKRILVICPYPEKVAPSQRLKYEQYFDYFREQGYEVNVSPFMLLSFWKLVYKKGKIFQKIYFTMLGYLKRTRDLFRLPFYDGVYIHLWVTPFGFPVFEFLFWLMNKKIVYDIDDMVFIDHKSVANRIISPLKGRKKMMYLMGKAKHVIVCTPFLKEIADKKNKNVTDISSTINTETYRMVNEYSNSKNLVVGWSGSHSTSKYLKLLETVFEKLKSKYNFNILVIGDASFSFNKVECEALPWTEATEVPNLQRIDIGVYPLPIKDTWVLGKSGLKALQYMALGIPTVASAVGANFRVIEDGVSGYLAETEDQWFDRIEGLLNDAQLRKRIGQDARGRVENYFSINANKDIYLKIINDAIFGETK